MDVSREVLGGLSLLSESRNRVTDEEVSQILATVTRSLSWNLTAEKEFGHDMDRAEQKLICLSLMSLIVTTARLNTGMGDEVMRITDILSDCEVSSERIAHIVTLYQQDRERLQQRLRSISAIDTQVPAFQDVKWSQEIVVKSNQLNRLQSPVMEHLISVRHESGSVEFCADVHDLQEIVHSLRECCKAIDSVKQSKHTS
jgi:hypothetical protein